MKTLHELVTHELEQAEPAFRQVILRIPLDNIDRWQANGHTAPHRLVKWRKILLNAKESPEGVSVLLALLRDSSKTAHPLKSFNPFLGVFLNAGLLFVPIDEVTAGPNLVSLLGSKETTCLNSADENHQSEPINQKSA